MLNKIKNNFLLYVILLTLAIPLYFLFFHFQPVITYTYSPLFDGNQYIKIYQYFRNEIPDYLVSFPYHSRILVPWLASLLPLPDLINFHVVNFLFILLAVITIFSLWQTLGIPEYLSFLGFGWLCLHWAGMIRLNIYDPITVDVPLYFFQSALLLSIIKKRYLMMILISILLVPIKESILPLILILLAYSILSWHQKTASPSAVFFFLTAFIGAIACKSLLDVFFAPIEQGRSSVLTLLFHIKETLQNPLRTVHWLGSLIMAFGPWIIIGLMVKWKKKILSVQEMPIFLMVIVTLITSFLGGNDFTRLIYLGFPFILTWVFLNIKNLNPWVWTITFITGLPLMRILQQIPDPARDGWEAFNFFYPEFTSIPYLLVLTGYGLFNSLILGMVLKKFNKST